MTQKRMSVVVLVILLSIFVLVLTTGVFVDGCTDSMFTGEMKNYQEAMHESRQQMP